MATVSFQSYAAQRLMLSFLIVILIIFAKKLLPFSLIIIYYHYNYDLRIRKAGVTYVTSHAIAALLFWTVKGKKVLSFKIYDLIT